jgi:hypothetical protein
MLNGLADDQRKDHELEDHSNDYGGHVSLSSQLVTDNSFSVLRVEHTLNTIEDL